jgi:hypothetical protein
MGQHPCRADVPRIGNNERTLALVKCAKCLPFFCLCSHRPVYILNKIITRFSHPERGFRACVNSLLKGTAFIGCGKTKFFEGDGLQAVRR